MNKLFLIEKKNLVTSNRLLYLTISLAIVSVMSFTTYLLLEDNKLMSSVEILFTLNIQIIFPIIFSSFMVFSIISDLKNGNRYLILLSPLSKDLIFITKALVNLRVTFISYLAMVNIYLIINLIYHKQTYVFIGFLKFNLLNVFLRVNAITVTTYFYLLCFSLMGIILTLLLRNFFLSIILILCIAIIHTVLPLPANIYKYLFFSTYNVYPAIQMVEYPIIAIAKAALINISNAILLFILSIKLYTKNFTMRDKNE